MSPVSFAHLWFLEECNPSENFHVLHLLLPKPIEIENSVHLDQNKSGTFSLEHQTLNRAVDFKYFFTFSLFFFFFENLEECFRSI